MINAIITFAISLLVFCIFAIIFKFLPNDYPAFHKENPFSDYYGVKINFGSIEFTNANWTYLKAIGFKTCAFCGTIHAILCIAFGVLNKTMLVSVDIKSFIISSAIVIGAFAAIFILIKFCRFDDKH